MAITVSGVESDLDITEWAEHMEAHARVSPSPDGVLSGFVVSAATGTRLLSVSAGDAVAPGVLIASSGAEGVTLDSNSSGNPRIDAIVLEVNWSGSSTTAGDVKAVKGTAGASPVAPSLTQTAGDVWQIPLAYVTVANGAGQLVAGNVAAAPNGTGYQSLTLASGFTHATPALAVKDSGGSVEVNGEFTRSGGGTLAVGSSATLTTIPFMRSRPATIYAATRGGSPKMVALQISGSGSVSLYPITGSLAVGDTVRVHATWLSEG